MQPRPQMRMGVTNEASLRSEPQQSLQHRQGDQLRVRQFRNDPHRGPLRRPLAVSDQQIINPHIQCSHDGVQVWIHAKILQDRGC